MNKAERSGGATFVLLGPPGAGKSTQGVRLSQLLEGTFFSTGNLLREEVNSQSALGQRIETIINAGGTVTEGLLLPVLEKTMTRISYGHIAILDFAGTGEQCAALDEMLVKYSRAVFASLIFEIPPSESRARLIARGRTDDEIEMIDKRLTLYEQEIVPVRRYYTERGLLRIVDGIGTSEEVTERLLTQILLHLPYTSPNGQRSGVRGQGSEIWGRRRRINQLINSLTHQRISAKGGSAFSGNASINDAIYGE